MKLLEDMERTLTIDSKIENLRLVEKFIDNISAEMQLSNQIYGNLMITVLEAANNAIVHGNKLEQNKKVNILLKKEPDFIEIYIKDEGNGFDYENVPDPTAPENIEKITGRGLFLMRKLSDGLELFDNGAKIKIIFKL